MIRILFLCHGNICRSPMAEFVMKKFVVTIESAIVVPMAFAQAVLPGYLADPKAKEVERRRAAWLLERNAR